VDSSPAQTDNRGRPTEPRTSVRAHMWSGYSIRSGRTDVARGSSYDSWRSLRTSPTRHCESWIEAADAPLAAFAAQPEIGTAPDLAARLIAEESRLAMEARLPWVEYARETFRGLRRGRDESARA
jgi:hypothetical protein